MGFWVSMCLLNFYDYLFEKNGTIVMVQWVDLLVDDYRGESTWLLGSICILINSCKFIDWVLDQQISSISKLLFLCAGFFEVCLWYLKPCITQNFNLNWIWFGSDLQSESDWVKSSKPNEL